MHWSEKYIGIPYIRGVADCARLVCDVREREFDGYVPNETDVERANSRLGRSAQIQDGVEIYGERTDKPEEGDVVLVNVLGRASHVGVFCIVNGENSILHAMENAGMVVLHKIRDLEKYRMSVEGYYKWKC